MTQAPKNSDLESEKDPYLGSTGDDRAQIPEQPVAPKKKKKNREDQKPRGPIGRTIKVIQNRILAGVFLALPIIITIIVIQWLYDTIVRPLFTRTASLLLSIWSEPLEQVDSPQWLINILSFVAAGVIILGGFFLLGMLFQSRLHRLFDWTLTNVPGVGKIYSSVSNVVQSIRQTQSDEDKFQRVVLVEFPQPGMRVPAFVTSSCKDAKTGKTILCVYVPTTPIPTSGYMLLIPAEKVTELSWDLQETLQAIVSGGITVPDTVDYHGPPFDYSSLDNSSDEQS